MTEKPKVVDVSEMSFDNSVSEKIIEVQSSKGDKISEMSFEVIGGNEPFNDDHLSHIDFDQEWLRLDQNSIMNSISMARKGEIKLQSDYSSVDLNEYAISPHT